VRTVVSVARKVERNFTPARKSRAQNFSFAFWLRDYALSSRSSLDPQNISSGPERDRIASSAML
jgi:hypothetical protein